MSKYTTGEIAKLCDVTVRTVQYYDQRGLLIPSELTEGGRRLYSEQDLIKMKIITFLRNLDFPLTTLRNCLDRRALRKWLKCSWQIRQGSCRTRLRSRNPSWTN